MKHGRIAGETAVSSDCRMEAVSALAFRPLNARHSPPCIPSPYRVRMLLRNLLHPESKSCGFDVMYFEILPKSVCTLRSGIEFPKGCLEPRSETKKLPDGA
jgi:hypothetical protein